MHRLRKLLLGLLILYWLLLAALTHAPRLPPAGPQISDKTAHLLAYAVLATLLFLTLWAHRPRLRFLSLRALLIPCAYAAVDELTQPLSGRVCEFADWVADALGAAAAVVALTLIRLLAHRRQDGRRNARAAAMDASG